MAPTGSSSQPPRVDRRTSSARAEGRDARDQLLEAALAVFAERGYRDASVDEIAERAGYSKGALYWHFKNKDGLFYALLEATIERPWLDAIKLLESAPPDRDMAPEAARHLAELMHDRREVVLIRQEYWALAVRDPELRRRYNARRKRLRSALAQAISARIDHLGGPPIKPEAAERMATRFVAMASGLAQEMLIDEEISEDLLGETYALLYAGHVARARGLISAPPSPPPPDD